MNSFKRKALTCAVLAGLGGIATTAEAVYRNPDGTGMVLIYPYYTVNSIGGNAYNTYISVTNTSTVAKVTKVRFREGRTSAEVLDFNLYLSPNDVWVAALVTQIGVLVHSGYFFDMQGGVFLVVSLLPEPNIFAEALRRIVPVLGT